MNILKLDFDLLQEILVYVEDKADGGIYIERHHISEHLIDMGLTHSQKVIEYHLIMLIRDEFFERAPVGNNKTCKIVDITTKGRELLYLLKNRNYIEQIIENNSKGKQSLLASIIQQFGVGTACNVFPQILSSMA